MRITYDVIKDVKRLFSQGMLSFRAIADKVGISNTSVANIVRGRINAKKVSDRGNRYKTCKEYRCPNCGRCVTLTPCPTCVAKAYRREYYADQNVVVGIGLVGEDLRRYNEIRKDR